MKQHVVQDVVAARYADGVDHVWAAWEPALGRSRRVMAESTWNRDVSPDQAAEVIRVAQYRAHTAAEFAAGLIPPPSAVDAHTYLVAALGACRDTLGVLAARAAEDELDAELAELGVTSLDVTFDAFRGARTTTALVHAWVAGDGVDAPIRHDSPASSRFLSMTLWTLTALCIVVVGALAVVLVLLAPPG